MRIFRVLGPTTDEIRVDTMEGGLGTVRAGLTTEEQAAFDELLDAQTEALTEDELNPLPG